MAEHMLILGLTVAKGKKYYVAAAFPSACGKTNMAMMSPTLPDWKVTTLGDDIAWIRVGQDGRLVCHESGNRLLRSGARNVHKIQSPCGGQTFSKNSIFTNVVFTHDGDVWWEEMDVPAPAHGIDWQGKSWTPESGRKRRPSEFPFHRSRRPMPRHRSRLAKSRGCAFVGYFFGGRRPSTIPLVNEALDWEHGVFMGSSCGSETTAAAVGQARGAASRSLFDATFLRL